MEITIRLTSEAETKKLAAIAAVLSGVGAVVAEPERELAAALADLAVARKSLAEAEAENDGLRQRVERLTTITEFEAEVRESGDPAAAGPRSGAVDPAESVMSPAAVSTPTMPAERSALSLARSEFDCDARYENDAPCDEPIVYDAQSRGHFCALHLDAPRSNRIEWRKAHGHRNTGRATG